MLPKLPSSINLADDPDMGGHEGRPEIWDWQRQAKEMAHYVDVRRSFAEHLLFRRPLNWNARRKALMHQEAIAWWAERQGQLGAELKRLRRAIEQIRDAVPTGEPAEALGNAQKIAREALDPFEGIWS